MSKFVRYFSHFFLDSTQKPFFSTFFTYYRFFLVLCKQVRVYVLGMLKFQNWTDLKKWWRWKVQKRVNKGKIVCSEMCFWNMMTVCGWTVIKFGHIGHRFSWQVCRLLVVTEWGDFNLLVFFFIFSLKSYLVSSSGPNS